MKTKLPVQTKVVASQQYISMAQKPEGCLCSHIGRLCRDFRIGIHTGNPRVRDCGVVQGTCP